MLYDKSTMIKDSENNKYLCVCADDEVAVFGKYYFDENENSFVTNYKNLFALHQDETIKTSFEIVN